jgi:hypothetical protein
VITPAKAEYSQTFTIICHNKYKTIYDSLKNTPTDTLNNNDSAKTDADHAITDSDMALNDPGNAIT